MKHLRVVSKTYLVGTVPVRIEKSLVHAIESVKEDVFFSLNQPRKDEIRGIDDGIRAFLFQNKSWTLEDKDFSPFANCEFGIDIACSDHKVLIEIEKGTSPRLELDILKIASACLQFPERWKYGALVVPSTYIKLRLAGRKTPYEYLEKHLKPLVRTVLEACKVSGFVVLGYEDPRPDGQ
jgi:hypothetical protein